MVSENSPSKVALADQPFIQLSSADAVVSAASAAGRAPLTTKAEAGSDWKLAAIAACAVPLHLWLRHRAAPYVTRTTTGELNAPFERHRMVDSSLRSCMYAGQM